MDVFWIHCRGIAALFSKLHEHAISASFSGIKAPPRQCP
jgi:hypothetical protein